MFILSGSGPLRINFTHATTHRYSHKKKTINRLVTIVVNNNNQYYLILYISISILILTMLDFMIKLLT